MNKSICQVDTDGNKRWFLNDRYHREDGPAIEYITGEKWWCRNGQCHREYGPAVEFSNGDRAWYRNGELHREDGPALEFHDFKKYWYLNDHEVGRLSGQPCNTQEQFEALMKVRAFW